MLNKLYAPLMDLTSQPFVWQEHTQKILLTALLSMVPMFEGRYAVTVMLGLGMPPVFAYLLAVIASYLPVPFILLLLRSVLDWFYTLPIRPVRAFAAWLERRAEKKRAGILGRGYLINYQYLRGHRPDGYLNTERALVPLENVHVRGSVRPLIKFRALVRNDDAVRSLARPYKPRKAPYRRSLSLSRRRINQHTSAASFPLRVDLPRKRALTGGYPENKSGDIRDTDQDPALIPRAAADSHTDSLTDRNKARAHVVSMRKYGASAYPGKGF